MEEKNNEKKKKEKRNNNKINNIKNIKKSNLKKITLIITISIFLINILPFTKATFVSYEPYFYNGFIEPYYHYRTAYNNYYYEKEIINDYNKREIELPNVYHRIGAIDNQYYDYAYGDYGSYNYGSAGWKYYKVEYSNPFYKYYSRYPYALSFFPNRLGEARIIW